MTKIVKAWEKELPAKTDSGLAQKSFLR